MNKNHIEQANIELIPIEGCSGCTACSHICPTVAIEMKADSQGFKYPQVNQDKCIFCSKCIAVCPYSKEILHQPNKDAFAVKNNEKTDQVTSTSGGFASALTRNVLEQGGKVFGVILTDNFEIKTVLADNIQTAEAFKGSKYVQTDLGDTFTEIANFLNQGMKVAFFGTSCHVDGLLHFLELKRVNCDKLVTVDFLCHGVPSPVLFKQYCDYASRYRKLTTYLFRTKANGWGTGSNRFAPTLVYGKRKETDTPLARAWIDLFFSNNCLRPHCYQCPYASAQKRSADMTMADFWGLKNVLPDFFDTDGVSLVLVNTTKGLTTFNALQNIITKTCSLESSVRRQTNFFCPSNKPLSYEKFWEDYNIKGFSYIIHNYTRYNIKGQLKYAVKKILRKL